MKFCQRCGEKVGGEAEKKDEEKPAEPSKPESKGETIGEKGIRVKCKDCKEEVDLMMPSCRCPICGCQHLDIKAQMANEGDCPF